MVSCCLGFFHMCCGVFMGAVCIVVVKVALWQWTCVVVVVVVRVGGVNMSRWMGSGDGHSAVVMTWQCCQ